MSSHDRADAVDGADGADGADKVRLAAALQRYRALANVVGVLLVVLCLIGLPLNRAHWLYEKGVIGSPIFPEGSDAQQLGGAISNYLGVAHGWLYMIFLLLAFMLSRRARWEPGFTILTLVCGTVPILSFWAEHRATRRVREQLAGGADRV